MTDHLSQAEIQKYFSLIGRAIPVSSIPEDARYEIQIAEAVEACGRRYSLRVWSRMDLADYLDRQSRLCADFAMAGAENLKKGIALDRQTFYLENPHGRRFPALGKVHFRPAERFPNGTERWKCAAIENIELHPSIRRKGFLARLSEVLRERGAEYLILQNVYNASLAYHLYQRSLKLNSHILVLTPDRVDFDRKISPGPAFAWRLCDSAW